MVILESSCQMIVQEGAFKKKKKKKKELLQEAHVVNRKTINHVMVILRMELRGEM